ncbi:MAG: hypothetical protein ACE37I_13105 [Rubinisphaera brasiliensis]|uniref:hypothetical protein n=1 Tax=Rubinisphaera brasiliensis TaxID=119 RepID=UPI00391D4C06|nr:hypothetical protein [bacterium]
MTDATTTDGPPLSDQQTAALAGLCKRLNLYIAINTVAIVAAVISVVAMLNSPGNSLTEGMMAIVATIVAVGTRQIIYLARITYKMEYPQAPPPLTTSRGQTE